MRPKTFPRRISRIYSVLHDNNNNNNIAYVDRDQKIKYLSDAGFRDPRVYYTRDIIVIFTDPGGRYVDDDRRGRRNNFRIINTLEKYEFFFFLPIARQTAFFFLFPNAWRPGKQMNSLTTMEICVPSRWRSHGPEAPTPPLAVRKKLVFFFKFFKFRPQHTSEQGRVFAKNTLHP